MRVLLILSISLTFWNLNAQSYKYEHEKTVSFKKVPEIALEAVKHICGQYKKGKWLKEMSIDQFSFEFKTRIEKQKISIEFDSSGNFEDLELNFSLKKLNQSIQNNISKYLIANYKAYQIKSLQLQWTSHEKALSYVSLSDYSNIEIVIKAQKGKKFGNFELLFGKEGNFISESEIIDKINSDHLDY